MADYNYVRRDAQYDELALANRLDDTARKNRKPRYALRHKESGLWLHVAPRSWQSVYTSAVEPSVKTLATVRYWLNRMVNPQAWEIVPMEVQPVTDLQALQEKIDKVQAAAKWHEAPEMPKGPGQYIAVWPEDGVWAASYWPGGVSRMGEDEAGEWTSLGNWVTPDGSVRTDPIAWRYLPAVPDKYLAQMRLFARDASEDDY